MSTLNSYFYARKCIFTKVQEITKLRIEKDLTGLSKMKMKKKH